uniref:Uncharacterized protein n=1 Tax=Oryza glaberrima TaxID=4538 RepID=I1PHC3_ORYGL
MARSPAAPPLLEGEELMDIPVEKRARKSMVVVRDANGEYCSGCVLKSKGKYTYVLTQSSFASGREDTLKICFFDQIEREASAFASGDTFCLLRTKRHTDCRPIKKMRGQVMPRTYGRFCPFFSNLCIPHPRLCHIRINRCTRPSTQPYQWF